jgi:hypothetical protein
MTALPVRKVTPRQHPPDARSRDDMIGPLLRAADG